MDRPLLVLASGSPRRRELLDRAGVAFEVLPAHIPEVERPGEPPAELARRLAGEKALAVSRRLGEHPRRWVLGADTVVALDGAVLGKPDDAQHALAILERLSGRTHEVVTGVAIAVTDDAELLTAVVTTAVTMRRSPHDVLAAYAASEEPRDKAGAYALQGEGRRFVEQVEGSESNVIGLPVDETLALLAAAGFPGPAP
ncbi:MAG: Maf family protein [Myxococcota bacterium]